MLTEVILATSNPGKVQELQTLLSPVRCIAQSHYGLETPDETGSTFLENALMKARFTCQQTGKPALADDSGLVVPALKGEPGIYSARYAGPNASSEDNMKHLLSRLAETPDTDRQAYFYCVLVLMQSPEDPTPLIATGTLWGAISTSSAGVGGFGYDPVFYLPGAQCTLAELAREEKNRISHRAQALQSLRQQLTTPTEMV